MTDNRPSMKNLLGPELKFWGMLLAYVIYNLGLAMSFSNVLTSGLNSLPFRLRGDGNAIFNAVQICGGALGTCLLSLIITLVGQHDGEMTKVMAMRNGGQWGFSFLLMVIILAALVI